MRTISGPIPTHAVDPQLLAGVWMAEREIMLTDNQLSREAKEALDATLSSRNTIEVILNLLL